LLRSGDASIATLSPPTRQIPPPRWRGNPANFVGIQTVGLSFKCLGFRRGGGVCPIGGGVAGFGGQPELLPPLEDLPAERPLRRLAPEGRDSPLAMVIGMDDDCSNMYEDRDLRLRAHPPGFFPDKMETAPLRSFRSRLTSRLSRDSCESRQLQSRGHSPYHSSPIFDTGNPRLTSVLTLPIPPLLYSRLAFIPMSTAHNYVNPHSCAVTSLELSSHSIGNIRGDVDRRTFICTGKKPHSSPHPFSFLTRCLVGQHPPGNAAGWKGWERPPPSPSPGGLGSTGRAPP